MSSHVEQQETGAVISEAGEDSRQVWIRVAFLTAGTIFAVFAGLWVVDAATDWNAEVAAGAVGAAGWLAAFIGLLGLSLQLRDHGQGAGLAGAILASLALVGAVVLSVGGFGELAGLWDERPDWFDPLNLLLFLGIIPGFLTVGIAGLRYDRWAKAMGYVLIAPAAIFIINLIRLGIAEPGAAISAILGGAQAAAMLSIAYLLREARSSRPV